MLNFQLFWYFCMAWNTNNKTKNKNTYIKKKKSAKNRFTYNI